MNNIKNYRWAIFIVIGLIYILACFHRVSPTVIARDLATSFNASAVMLGFIASIYFYLYSASQPFVGFFTDSFGPRKVITVSTIIASLGCLIFGTASTIYGAILGRALIGMGAAGVFIPALKVFASWYKPNEFATLTGSMIGISGISYITAALPLACSVSLFGWRLTHVGIAVVSFSLAILCWIIVRDSPGERGLAATDIVDDTTLNGPSFVNLDKNSRSKSAPLHILRRLDFWMLFGTMFFTGGVSFSFQGLWAIPYLMDVHGLNRIAAGEVLTILPLGYVVSGPVTGILADKFSTRKQTILFCSIGFGITAWTALLVRGDSSYSVAIVAFFLSGLSAGGVLPVLFSMIKDIFPQKIMGTVLGLLNPASFVGAILYQPLSGVFFERSGRLASGSYAGAAYRRLFLFFILSYLLAIAAAWMISNIRKHSKPLSIERNLP